MRNRLPLFFISILVLVFTLSACGHSNVADEFKHYNKHDRVDIYKKSLKLQEMESKYISLMKNPKKAHQYLTKQFIPSVKEVKNKTEDIQEGLKTQEVKNLNSLALKQMQLTLDMLKKQDDILTLRASTKGKEGQEKAEKIYQQVQKLSKEIQKIGKDYEEKRKEMVKKYGEH